MAVQSDASQWTLTRVFAGGTPSPKDIRVTWTGTCPEEADPISVDMFHNGNPIGMTRVECRQGKFTAAFMLHDYEDRGLKKGQGNDLVLAILAGPKDLVQLKGTINL
ncbi:hypothetical protein [Kitasatospora sp. NPDC127116]|uniref:hypothetical protein n=1 Tax=Kitasatospora sp. NPDC127116 TaxID=3345367 RepID=UPI00363CE36C